MTPRFRFMVGVEAEADVADAAEWYEGEAPGLGDEFFRAVDVCFAAIRRWPESHAVVLTEPDATPPVRRALVRRFPYSVYYIVEREYVRVLACLHQRRDPDVWRRRARGE